MPYSLKSFSVNCNFKDTPPLLKNAHHVFGSIWWQRIQMKKKSELHVYILGTKKAYLHYLGGEKSCANCSGGKIIFQQ